MENTVLNKNEKDKTWIWYHVRVQVKLWGVQNTG